MTDPLAEPVRFIDERTAAAPQMRKLMRYLFPDHWSFLLGEVALYAFVVLIATGIYLTLFFDPSTAKTVYHGAYAPLDGVRVSDAYKSVVDISFSDKAGLLIRQTHHWAADVFVAAILMHLMRVFFTGAFRKPRELTWIVGLILLFTALLEGYMGYSLVDDLLSGMGLAIGYGVGLSIPVIGGPAMLAIFGAPFPGGPSFRVAPVHRARAAGPAPAGHADRGAPGAGDGAPPHPVSRERAPHPEADRRGAAVPRAGTAVAGADVLRGRPAVSPRRAHPDQPDLAVGSLRAMAGHQRRAARLVSGLADRRAATDAGV